MMSNIDFYLKTHKGFKYTLTSMYFLNNVGDRGEERV